MLILYKNLKQIFIYYGMQKIMMLEQFTIAISKITKFLLLELFINFVLFQQDRTHCILKRIMNYIPINAMFVI